MNTKEKTQFGKNPPTKEELQKVNQVIDGLSKDPQAYDFLEPVDVVALGLDDYLDIVKTPMDVSTIRKNIKNNKYSSVKDIFADIQLIWDNCRTYNMEGSEIYKMANHCEKIVKKLIDKHFKQTSNSTNTKSAKKTEKNDSNADEEEGQNEGDTDDYLQIHEKILLTEKVRKLNNEGLASLVKLIQKECSVAIEDIDSEKLQIRVDNINRKTFELINQLIETISKTSSKSQ